MQKGARLSTSPRRHIGGAAYDNRRHRKAADEATGDIGDALTQQLAV